MYDTQETGFSALSHLKIKSFITTLKKKITPLNICKNVINFSNVKKSGEKITLCNAIKNKQNQSSLKGSWFLHDTTSLQFKTGFLLAPEEISAQGIRFQVRQIPE